MRSSTPHASQTVRGRPARLRAAQIVLALLFCLVTVAVPGEIHGELGEILRSPEPRFELGWSSLETDATTSVAAGDYDNDGDLDLIVGNRGQPNRLYRNDGGTLAAAATWSAAAGLQTTGVVWGDVDGDGDLDLAVGNNGQSNQLYRNQGGVLTLDTAWSPAAMPTTSIAWGDVDGDDDLDLAVGNNGQPNQLYRNQGGVLTLDTAWSPAAMPTTSIAWGDMDGDGDLDLAVGNSGQPNQLYRNDAGTLQFETRWRPAATTTTSIAWGDANGQGNLSLVVGHESGSQIYEGFITGGLPSEPAWSGAALFNEGGSAVAWGHVDDDRRLDLIFGVPVLQLGLVTSRRSWSKKWESAETHRVTSLAWADMDGDGDQDVIVGNNGQPNRIYYNQVETLDPELATWSSTRQIDSVAWGDIDNDGDLDLAMTFVEGFAPAQRGELYRNQGGTLTLDPSWAPVDNPGSLAWGDVDGDGDLDLAVGRENAPNQLYRNQGGVLTLDTAWSPAAMPTTSIAWGDVDGDDDLDLAVGNNGQPNQLYRNQGGVLTLDTAWSPAAMPTTSLAWGDMDGDGDLDLAVGNSGQPNQIYGNDRGSLRDQPTWAAQDVGDTQSIAWGDVNGDGYLDLATGNRDQPNRLYTNIRGQIAPMPTWSSVESEDTYGVAWGDYDNDGDLDLAVANLFGRIRLYRNDRGALTPSAPWFSVSAGFTRSVAWADVDQDGDLDLSPGNELFRNYRDFMPSPAAAPTITLAHPGSVGASHFYGSAEVLSAGQIPINYTLYHPQGTPVREIVAEYSLDGGAHWRLARPAAGTPTSNLPTNASTPGDVVTASTTEAQQIADGSPESSGLTVSTLTVEDEGMVADLNLTLDLQHDWIGDLVIILISPSGRRVTLVNRRGGGSDDMEGTLFDDEASQPISVGTGPFSGGYRPEQALSHLDGDTLRGTWTLQIFDTSQFDTGVLRSWGISAERKRGAAHTFVWDAFGSGFTGQSDNVVVRMTAIPDLAPGPGRNSGGFVYGASASTTTPFRVRGTQIQVVRPDGTGVRDALVYRLPAGQTLGAQPITSIDAIPFRTNDRGFLQGRGVLQVAEPTAPGDQIVALAPVVISDTFTLYHTSGSVTAESLALTPVSAAGVQQLTVSPEHPLLLFNLDVALEWDARGDQQFIGRLSRDLRRASEILYDWTDGQAALGTVTVFHDAKRLRYEGGWDLWAYAHVRVYASNRLRPNANKGGVVPAPRTDPDNPDYIYEPGQIRIGAIWNRYGESEGLLGEDWPRTLAHELGHYLFFLDDNYIGLNDSRRLIPVDSCRGAMSDPYRDDFSEFHPRDGEWTSGCARTLSQLVAGRADWESLRAFYPEAGLRAPASYNANPGPTRLPLAVTEVVSAPHESTPQGVEVPIFNLEDERGAPVQPGTSARAFLFQGSQITDLGRPTLDRVQAYGAAAGDRICVFEPGGVRLGCEEVRSGDQTLTLTGRQEWQPEVVVTPVTSRTLTVVVSQIPGGLPLQAQIFPADAPAGPAIRLQEGASSVYMGTFMPAELPEPVFEGYIHITVLDGSGRETVVDYALGGNPGKRWSRAAPRGDPGKRWSRAAPRGSPGKRWSRAAPVISADGQVILYTEREFAEGEFYAFQTASRLSGVPPWVRPVGQAYRLTATEGAPSLSDASLSLGYLQADVPDGEEQWLALYYWNDAVWEELPTDVNTTYNLASAPVRGEGVYVLTSSLQVPLGAAGWNTFRYPVRGERPVAEALASITNEYRVIYRDDGPGAAERWKLHAPGVPGYVNSLSQLTFNRDYYLWLKQPMVIRLRGPELSADGTLAAGLTLPPATYYGRVQPEDGFAPQAGATVEALIDGVVCGQGTTRLVSGDVVYVVSVDAVDPMRTSTCGTAGKTVEFRVGGEAMKTTGVWDNTLVQAVDLSRSGASAPISSVFLPILQR